MHEPIDLRVRVLLHQGVTWEQDGLVDGATRERIKITGARDGTEANTKILLLGLGFTPHSFRDRLVLLLSALSMRTTRPWKMIRYGFRRRVPDAALHKVLVATCAAGRIPAIAMLVLFVVPALAVGIWLGTVGEPIIFALLVSATCWASMITHEAAHLVLIRTLEGDSSIGAIVHSWLNVWIVGPRLSPARRRLVAAAGPVAGIAACAIVGFIGVPQLICFGVGAIHLVNLLPSAPDGRALFS